MDWSETLKRCEIVLFLYLLAGTSPSLVGLTLNGFCGFSSAVQELSLQSSSSNQVIQISTWYLWYFLNLLFGLTATPLDTGVEKYINDPTSTTLETTDYPIWNIDFPGVTICPNAKVFYIKKIKNKSFLSRSQQVDFVRRWKTKTCHGRKSWRTIRRFRDSSRCQKNPFYVYVFYEVVKGESFFFSFFLVQKRMRTSWLFLFYHSVFSPDDCCNARN